MDQTVTFIAALVTEEIRRTIADAIESGSILSAAAVAAQVSRTYPNYGHTEKDIADRVMMTAAKAGVAVEIGGDRMTASA